jgi:hypothetical protein
MLHWSRRPSEPWLAGYWTTYVTSCGSARREAAWLQCGRHAQSWRLFDAIGYSMAVWLRFFASKTVTCGFGYLFFISFAAFFGRFICCKSGLQLSVDGHMILFDERHRGAYWRRIGLPAFRSRTSPWYRGYANRRAARRLANLTVLSLAPPIPGTPAPVSAPTVSAPIAGCIVIITGRHRWRCARRSWRHDNNGRSCCGRCHSWSCAAVCWSRVIVEWRCSCVAVSWCSITVAIPITRTVAIRPCQ